MFEISNIFVTLVILAAVSDVFFRKIPNALNFTLLLSGLFFALMGLNKISWLDSLLGIAISLGVLLIPFALQVYRGGDIKLCMGISAWLGVEQGLWVIGLGILGGGLLGLLMLPTMGSKKGNKKVTVPMAVCFTLAGLWVERFGIPF